jgi:hypothetical protein
MGNLVGGGRQAPSKEEEQAKVLSDQGADFLRAGQVDQALNAYERALAIAVQIGNKPLQGVLRNAINRARTTPEPTKPLPGGPPATAPVVREASPMSPTLTPAGPGASTPNVTAAKRRLIEELVALGVTQERAEEAARRHSTVEAAVDWLISKGHLG